MWEVYWENFIYFFKTVFNITPIRLLLSIGSYILLFMFQSESMELYTALLFLIVLDAFFGMWRSVKCGIKISSTRFFSTIIKVVVYFCGVIAPVNLLAHIHVIFSGLETFALTWLGATEVISIMENCVHLNSNLIVIKVVQDRVKHLFQNYNDVDKNCVKPGNHRRKKNSNS